MAYLALSCRVTIGIVFAVSVIAKVRRRAAFESFKSWLATLPLPVASEWPAACAIGLTAIELGVAVLVAFPRLAPAGLGLAAVLLAIFACGAWLALQRGTRSPCHCFGAGVAPLGRRHVVRDFTLCAMSVTGAVAARPVTEVGGIVISAGVAVAVAFSFIFLDDVAALFTGFHYQEGEAPHG